MHSQLHNIMSNMHYLLADDELLWYKPKMYNVTNNGVGAGMGFLHTTDDTLLSWSHSL